MSNQERSMKWWPNSASPIVSRRAQTFFALISMKSWSGRAEKINDLRDRCCYHARVLLVAATLKENRMSVYKRGKKGTHWHYYFRVRGVRYRGSLPEARTKQQAEQAESKIKQEIFEKRFELEQKGTDLLSDFLDDVYLPWSKVNKKSWRDDVYMVPMLKAHFEGKALREISVQLVER